MDFGRAAPALANSRLRCNPEAPVSAVRKLATFTARTMFPRARSSAKFNITDSIVIRARGLWPLFVKHGRRTNLSPYLLLAVAIGESDLIPTAVNPSSGALGLMQIMPLHDSTKGGGIAGLLQKWRDPDFNMGHGADILAYQVRVRGGVEKGLAGYGGFSSWLRDPRSVEAGGPKDASWYIDEALGRAFTLELANELGSLGLGPAT
jgi:soluble lytic murein transglycosylase-like protein